MQLLFSFHYYNDYNQILKIPITKQAPTEISENKTQKKMERMME